MIDRIGELVLGHSKYRSVEVDFVSSWPRPTTADVDFVSSWPMLMFAVHILAEVV